MKKKDNLELKEIVQKWENGKKVAELAKEYGISITSIYNRLNKYYLITGKEKPRIPRKKIPIEKIIIEWKNGKSTLEIANQYKISKTTINRRINAYYKMKNQNKEKVMRSNKIKIPIEEMIQKWNEGIKQQQLAKEYGISITTIRNRINEHYNEKGEKKPEKRGGRKEIPIEEIVEKWKNGIFPQKLAEEYNISIATVYKRICEYNKNNVVKNKILNNKDIVVEYLKKGLSEQQIKNIAKGKKIIIPDDVMNQANKEAICKKDNLEKEI